MESTNSSASSSSDSMSNRTDAALIEKCKNQLCQSRNQFAGYAKDCPGFNPQFMKELCAKLDEGIEYAQGLAKLSLQDAHDITVTDVAAARKPPVVLTIDSPASLAMMIEHIVQAHAQASSTLDLFIDTEGDCLTGALSLIQIFVQSIETVYLIDVIELGGTAFTTPGLTCGLSLKDIFESAIIRKAVYGIKGDSHDLWKHYGIYVSAIDDLHLMGIAAYGFKRKGGRKLGQCVQENTKGELSDVDRKSWIARKDWGVIIFQETNLKHKNILDGNESGDGWVPLFNVRPIPQEVRDYAVADVTVLPILSRCYAAKLPQLEDGDAWIARVAEKTEEHIVKSQSLDYDPNVKGETGVPEWLGLRY